ncbi:LOW QUALITY PROTEIN: hypothetical protein PHPALM_2114 [Phytophthora palmivora]|uniref:MYND-type domain-containing protein n=1 Tax=Phytophthora palmivora TaxID=4796 RepID=A0A2P4YQK1_9STRA|nr:LOW QUALITY PROTEIN: hypothetical protein PHPALM_2114 [Phytophthora palmivora]
MRLLEHFKQHGGEVWSLGSGCQKCRQKVEDVSKLKRCAKCDAALFCSREGQVQAESLSSNAKKTHEPKVTGVARSIGMNEAELPGWFFTVDVEAASKEQQKTLYQAVLELYGLLKDEECWTRDKESFPRSSYTLVECKILTELMVADSDVTTIQSLPHASPAAGQLQKEFVEMNGHLLLFSAWLQHPEPPATQAMPFEDRNFFGVVDSLLQISVLRDGVDAFMDARTS